MKNQVKDVPLKREIGIFTATVLVVANMIGTGIFTTSGFIIQEVGHPLVLLLCWLSSGLLSLPAHPQWSLTISYITLCTISPINSLAIASIVILSLVHYRSITVGSRVQNTLNSLKIVIIILFITGGFFLGAGSQSPFSIDFPQQSCFKRLECRSVSRQ